MRFGALRASLTPSQWIALGVIVGTLSGCAASDFLPESRYSLTIEHHPFVEWVICEKVEVRLYLGLGNPTALELPENVVGVSVWKFFFSLDEPIRQRLMRGEVVPVELLTPQALRWLTDVVNQVPRCLLASTEVLPKAVRFERTTKEESYRALPATLVRQMAQSKDGFRFYRGWLESLDVESHAERMALREPVWRLVFQSDSYELVYTVWRRQFWRWLRQQIDSERAVQQASPPQQGQPHDSGKPSG